MCDCERCEKADAEIAKIDAELAVAATLTGSAERIIRISGCRADCPYECEQTGSCILKCKPIPKPDTVPDWCPLEKAECKTEDVERPVPSSGYSQWQLMAVKQIVGVHSIDGCIPVILLPKSLVGKLVKVTIEEQL